MIQFYQSKKGSLSVDFMFGISILSIALIFIVLIGLSLVYAEIAQYVTYSSARKYFASHSTQLVAATEAQKKYKELQGDLFPPDNSWFYIGINDNPNSPPIFVNSQSNKMPFDDKAPQRITFGIYTEYTSKVFGMKIPFLKDASRSMFFPTATVLGKEPNREDSINFLSRQPSENNKEFFKNDED